MNNRGIELVNVAPYIREKAKLKELAGKAVVPTDNAKRLITQMIDDKNGHKRQPKPPPPEGGICQSEASRKYGIGQRTISRWFLRGRVQRIKHPNNREIYLDESALIKLINAYKENPGQGKRTILQSQNAS